MHNQSLRDDCNIDALSFYFYFFLMLVYYMGAFLVCTIKEAFATVTSSLLYIRYAVLKG